MNNSFDFSCRCDHYVLLSIDGEHKRNDEERSRPFPESTARSDSGSARIDRCENGGVADSTQARHENEFRERGAHFATNKLEEGRQLDVCRRGSILATRRNLRATARRRAGYFFSCYDELAIIRQIKAKNSRDRIDHFFRNLTERLLLLGRV